MSAAGRHSWKKTEPSLSQCRRCGLERLAGEPGHFEYRPKGFKEFSVGGRASDYPCEMTVARVDLLASLLRADQAEGRKLAASAFAAGIVRPEPARVVDTNRAVKSHRESYPEQYSHALCGKLVRWAGGKAMGEIAGRVERVVSSRFGLLVIFEGTDGKTSHAIGSVVLAESRKPEPAAAIDELLRARGFERGYYHGGPPVEAPFTETERGIRFYLRPTDEAVTLVTTRGTFRYFWTPGVRPVRGAGVGQLVRAMRTAR